MVIHLMYQTGHVLLEFDFQFRKTNNISALKIGKLKNYKPGCILLLNMENLLAINNSYQLS